MRKLYSNILIVLISLFSILTALTAIFLPKIVGVFLRENPDIDQMVSQVNLVHYITQSLLLLLFIGSIAVLLSILLYKKNEVYTKKFILVVNFIITLCILASIGVVLLSCYVNSIDLLSPLMFILALAILLMIITVTLVIIIVRLIILDTITYKINLDSAI